ncbi:MAG TPA: hypothetical protein VGO93_10815 [Candidatus Xenobia bacterium]|jgi:hypothetical protein
MVIPVYLLALYFVAFWVVVYQAPFWWAYHLVDQAGAGFSWSCLVGSPGAVEVVLLAANWGVFWTLGRCLFIFDSLARPQAWPHARPGLFVLAGGLFGVAWSAALSALLAWHNPGDATSLAIAHPWWGGWLALGGLLGMIAASGVQRGLAKELPTAHMAPPPAQVISGEMPVPIQ